MFLETIDRIYQETDLCIYTILNKKKLNLNLNMESGKFENIISQKSTINTQEAKTQTEWMPKRANKG